MQRTAVCKYSALYTITDFLWVLDTNMYRWKPTFLRYVGNENSSNRLIGFL